MLDLMNLELWQWVAGLFAAAGTGVSGFWLARRKDSREEKASLSEAERQFRTDMRAEMQRLTEWSNAQDREIERLEAARRSDFDAYDAQRKIDRKKCDDEFMELRTQHLSLHDLYSKQHIRINNLESENSDLRTKVAMNSVPGGRRQTDPTPAAQLMPPIPPGAAFDFRVSSTPAPTDPAATPNP